jgi:hypothetical protein
METGAAGHVTQRSPRCAEVAETTFMSFSAISAGLGDLGAN